MASKEKYDWLIGQPPPRIDHHTTAKHRALASYLRRYIRVLTQDPRLDRVRLDIVDAFAGGGTYWDPMTGKTVPGSPILALRTLREAEFEAQSHKTKPFSIDSEFFFLDSKKPHIEYLNNELNVTEFKSKIGNSIFLFNDEFQNKNRSIVEHIRKRQRAGRAIFILDQYGYAEVPLKEVRYILNNLPHSEVILTFHVSSLLRYISKDGAVQRSLDSIDVGHIDLSNIKLAPNTNDWKYEIQRILYKRIIHATGAGFFTNFFIKSFESGDAYWLVHLSNAWKARDEMMSVHWEQENAFIHYGGSGFWMLGYDAGADPAASRSQSFNFDENAMERSRSSLIEDIPKCLEMSGRGQRFEELMNDQFNFTPANRSIISSALDELVAEGEIEMITKSGNKRRSAHRLKSPDVLRMKPQRSFSFPPGTSKK